MRIGVEACTWANRRGYGRFTRELVSAMVARHPQHEFVLVVDSHTARECSFPCDAQTLVVPTAVQPTRAAAMACGVPVAASNRNSIPEVLDGAGLLFEPDSDEDIARCMLRLLRDAPLRARLRERGLARAEAYSWKTGADTMMRVLEDAARR